MRVSSVKHMVNLNAATLSRIATGIYMFFCIAKVFRVVNGHQLNNRTEMSLFLCLSYKYLSVLYRVSKTVDMRESFVCVSLIFNSE